MLPIQGGYAICIWIFDSPSAWILSSCTAYPWAELSRTADCCVSSFAEVVAAVVTKAKADQSWVVQSNLTAEAKSAQEKAIEIAKQLAKPPAGWQQNQPANSYLPNGDPSALLKAAQDVAQSLNMKVPCLPSYTLLLLLPC